MPAPDHPPRSSAVRRLFFDEGENGHSVGEDDNTANALLEEMRRDKETAKRNWNFDFETETPLEGRWQWTPVSAPSAASSASGVASSLRTPLVSLGDSRNETLSSSSVNHGTDNHGSLSVANTIEHSLSSPLSTESTSSDNDSSVKTSSGR